MKRVITASLNRNAFQFEEDAHARLESWLAEASARLQSDPDRAEILADLEQAVADQCTQRLRPHQTVITLEELQPALDQVGRVETPEATAAPQPGAASASGTANAPPLQQISQGAWISGVCLGLARYAGLDPMLVRVGAIVLSALTGGTGVIVYAVLMLVLPFAPLDPTLPPPNELSAMCRKDATALRDWILKDVR